MRKLLLRPHRKNRFSPRQFFFSMAKRKSFSLSQNYFFEGTNETKRSQEKTSYAEKVVVLNSRLVITLVVLSILIGFAIAFSLHRLHLWMSTVKISLVWILNHNIIPYSKLNYWLTIICCPGGHLADIRLKSRQSPKIWPNFKSCGSLSLKDSDI